MDETQPPNDRDDTGTAGKATPTSPDQLGNPMQGDILGAASRILQSPAHMRTLARLSSNLLRNSTQRPGGILGTGTNGRLGKYLAQRDDERILSRRDATPEKWPGACSEKFPGARFNQIVELAERIITADEERSPTQNDTQASARQNAKTLLLRASAMTNMHDPDYTRPVSQNFSLIEMVAAITRRMEVDIASDAVDPSAFLAERQSLIEAIPIATEAFNVAALEGAS